MKRSVGCECFNYRNWEREMHRVQGSRNNTVAHSLKCIVLTEQWIVGSNPDLATMTSSLMADQSTAWLVHYRFDLVSLMQVN